MYVYDERIDKYRDKCYFGIIIFKIFLNLIFA